MKYQISNNQDEIRVRFSGHLSFEDRVAADSLAADIIKQNASSVILDLEEVDYIDSAGLGILLTVRERISDNGGNVRLSNPTGTVREILELACFDMLFDIDWKN